MTNKKGQHQASSQDAKPYVRPAVVSRGDIMDLTKGLADAGGDTGFTLGSPS